jgi:hypothetical protein
MKTVENLIKTIKTHAQTYVSNSGKFNNFVRHVAFCRQLQRLKGVFWVTEKFFLSIIFPEYEIYLLI